MHKHEHVYSSQTLGHHKCLRCLSVWQGWVWPYYPLHRLRFKAWWSNSLTSVSWPFLSLMYAWVIRTPRSSGAPFRQRTTAAPRICRGGRQPCSESFRDCNLADWANSLDITEGDICPVPFREDASMDGYLQPWYLLWHRRLWSS